jgi:hypothetical protein
MMASIISIVPTAVVDIFLLVERAQSPVWVSYNLDLIFVPMNIAWHSVIVLSNYIVWKGKLQIEKT